MTICICGVRHRRLEPSDRNPAINDHDRLTTTNPIDKRAQSVLRFGDRGYKHIARIASSIGLFKPVGVEGCVQEACDRV